MAIDVSSLETATASGAGPEAGDLLGSFGGDFRFRLGGSFARNSGYFGGRFRGGGSHRWGLHPSWVSAAGFGFLDFFFFFFFGSPLGSAVEGPRGPPARRGCRRCKSRICPWWSSQKRSAAYSAGGAVLPSGRTDFQSPSSLAGLVLAGPGDHHGGALGEHGVRGSGCGRAGPVWSFPWRLKTGRCSA